MILDFTRKPVFVSIIRRHARNAVKNEIEMLPSVVQGFLPTYNIILIDAHWHREQADATRTLLADRLSHRLRAKNTLTIIGKAEHDAIRQGDRAHPGGVRYAGATVDQYVIVIGARSLRKSSQEPFSVEARIEPVPIESVHQPRVIRGL